MTGLPSIRSHRTITRKGPVSPSWNRLWGDALLSAAVPSEENRLCGRRGKDTKETLSGPNLHPPSHWSPLFMFDFPRACTWDFYHFCSRNSSVSRELVPLCKQKKVKDTEVSGQLLLLPEAFLISTWFWLQCLPQPARGAQGPEVTERKVGRKLWSGRYKELNRNRGHWIPSLCVTDPNLRAAPVFRQSLLITNEWKRVSPPPKKNPQTFVGPRFFGERPGNSLYHESFYTNVRNAFNQSRSVLITCHF